MRRSRKPRVVWLPTTNTFSTDTANRQVWQTNSVQLDNTSGNPGLCVEMPVVIDGIGSDPLDPTSTLSDIENSGYRLRRIVGKVYCFLSQTNSTTGGEDIYGVTAGFIIRRTDTAGNSLAAQGVNSNINIGPDDIDNSMDPWIWRRSWLLSNGANSVSSTGLKGDEQSGFLNSGPHTNYGKNAGNLQEGPFVDQKTARVVGPEERLFLDVMGSPLFINEGTPCFLVVVTNLRVLASMRTSVGNRRNASR